MDPNSTNGTTGYHPSPFGNVLPQSRAPEQLPGTEQAAEPQTAAAVQPAADSSEADMGDSTSERVGNQVNERA